RRDAEPLTPRSSMSKPGLKAEGSDDLRPRGTVQRECSLCGWATWYDPLSPEATAPVLVCTSCQTNELCWMTCERCQRWFPRGHRDAYTLERGHECDDCRRLAADAEPPAHYCQGLQGLGPHGDPSSCGASAVVQRRYGYSTEPSD